MRFLSLLRPRKRTASLLPDKQSRLIPKRNARRRARHSGRPRAAEASLTGRNGRHVAHEPGSSSSSRRSMSEPRRSMIETGIASAEAARTTRLPKLSSPPQTWRRDRFRVFRSWATRFRRGIGEELDRNETRPSGTVCLLPQFCEETAVELQMTTAATTMRAVEARQVMAQTRSQDAAATERITTPLLQRQGHYQSEATRPQMRPLPKTRVVKGDEKSLLDRSSSSPGGDSRLEKLWRLPSLSLSVKRALSRRRKPSKRVETSQEIVKPATVLSDPSLPVSAAFPVLPSPQKTQSSSRGGIGHNKPLPPTPVDDHQHYKVAFPASSTTSRPNLLRPNRIMATLSHADILKLFSGAPQYFARSKGHFWGAPHPSVAFPWNEELAIRDLTDHVQIEDPAWSCITARPHITRDVLCRPSALASRKVSGKRRAHFYPSGRERPIILSMQGLEKGTVGYQAALELSVADALQEEPWASGSLGAKKHAMVEARKHLVTSKDGVRCLEESTVLNHLIKNAQRYQEEHSRDRAVCHELFQELFTQILEPPNRTFTDPFSLSVQIASLLKILATPDLWIDFSRVEWRIRLGQLLWGAVDDDAEDSVSDSASINDPEKTKELHEARHWLLLQILLACELLIRLDIITEHDELPKCVKPSEVLRFEREANSTVKWSLHLARAWLENIEITDSKSSASGEQLQPKGWLANLTHKVSLASDLPYSRHHDRYQNAYRQQPIYIINGKHWERQVRGLTHFARRLQWPGIDTQSALISENCRAVMEGTPLKTASETPVPTLPTTSKDGPYFGLNYDNSTGSKSRRHKVEAALHPAGWLSKSYISGLMLPGEGLYHFIMSTLLETDTVALQKLGPIANLSGGFVYSGKSFWSTACVVGRILAAGKGAVECMGWISSDVVPHNLKDGWMNIDVEDVPGESLDRGNGWRFSANTDKATRGCKKDGISGTDLVQVCA